MPRWPWARAAPPPPPPPPPQPQFFTLPSLSIPAVPTDRLHIHIPILIASLFFLDLLVIAARNRRMFLARYGRHHRVMGALFLALLVLGYYDASQHIFSRPVFDTSLSLAGIALTVSAAVGFGGAHRAARVNNRASGALDPEATVTAEEMWEHCFYQCLNLAQVLYIHAAGRLPSAGHRFAACALATLPWAWRGRFPVHSFSKNYAGGEGGSPWSLVSLMYRAKKWQYVFYKHALLHGLNASLMVSGEAIGDAPHFRVYWASLNSAYALEFFLQTLVKRGYLRQGRMLALNRALMVVSTAAAAQVLYWHVSPAPFLLSLTLNFANRHHEILNSLTVLLTALSLEQDPRFFAYFSVLAGGALALERSRRREITEILC